VSRYTPSTLHPLYALRAHCGIHTYVTGPERVRIELQIDGETIHGPSVHVRDLPDALHFSAMQLGRELDRRQRERERLIADGEAPDLDGGGA